MRVSTAATATAVTATAAATAAAVLVASAFLFYGDLFTVLLLYCRVLVVRISILCPLTANFEYLGIVQSKC